MVARCERVHSVRYATQVVPPKPGHKHEQLGDKPLQTQIDSVTDLRCTLIYLHGCSCNARQYLEDGWELPWTGKERWPGLRTVLPDAKVMRPK